MICTACNGVGALYNLDKYLGDCSVCGGTGVFQRRAITLKQILEFWQPPTKAELVEWTNQEIEIRKTFLHVDTICTACEGGGWECYGLGFNDPHFRTCPECHNPEDLPCP